MTKVKSKYMDIQYVNRNYKRNYYDIFDPMGEEEGPTYYETKQTEMDCRNQMNSTNALPAINCKIPERPIVFRIAADEIIRPSITEHPDEDKICDESVIINGNEKVISTTRETRKERKSLMNHQKMNYLSTKIM